MNLIEGMRSEFAKSKKWHNAGLFAGGFVNCISFIDFSDGRNFIKGFKRRRINHSVLIFIFRKNH